MLGIIILSTGLLLVSIFTSLALKEVDKRITNLVSMIETLNNTQLNLLKLIDLLHQQMCLDHKVLNTLNEVVTQLIPKEEENEN